MVMILITGGAYQGKHKVAKNLYRQEKERLKESVRTEGAEERLKECARTEGAEEHLPDPVTAEGGTGDLKQFQTAEIILKFHLWIRRLMKEETDPYVCVKELLLENPGVIITFDQIGCGVVPMDSFERKFRELAGRMGCLLAEQAEEVYLVNCGIAKKIK